MAHTALPTSLISGGKNFGTFLKMKLSHKIIPTQIFPTALYACTPNAPAHRKQMNNLGSYNATQHYAEMSSV